MTASSKELSQEALNLASFSFSLEQKTALFTQLKQQRGILFQRDIIALCNEHKLTETQLLKACVPVASLFLLRLYRNFMSVQLHWVLISKAKLSSILVRMLSLPIKH